MSYFFFFQAEDGIRDKLVTGVQTCALPISRRRPRSGTGHPMCGRRSSASRAPSTSRAIRCAPSRAGSPRAASRSACRSSGGPSTRRPSSARPTPISARRTGTPDIPCSHERVTPRGGFMTDRTLDQRLAALEARLGRLESRLAALGDPPPRGAPSLEEAKDEIRAWGTEYVSLRLQQLVPETCAHPEREAGAGGTEGPGLPGTPIRRTPGGIHPLRPLPS